VTQVRRRFVRARREAKGRLIHKVQPILPKISVSLHCGKLQGVRRLLAAALAVEAVG